MDSIAEEKRGDSKLYKGFKRIFRLWLTAMVLVTIYGGLQHAWWLGVLVAVTWLGGMLFLDPVFMPKVRPA